VSQYVAIERHMIFSRGSTNFTLFLIGMKLFTTFLAALILNSLSMVMSLPRDPAFYVDTLEYEAFSDANCTQSTQPFQILDVEKCSVLEASKLSFNSFDGFTSTQTYFAHCDIRGDMEFNVCQDKECATCLLVVMLSQSDKGKCLPFFDDKVYIKAKWTCPEYKDLALLKQD
jgi:hypothetical protein